MVIVQALDNLIVKAQQEQDSMALIILRSFKEYVENGGKLSNLTWFNGIDFEKIEMAGRKAA